jgi:hypothetical protein
MLLKDSGKPVLDATAKSIATLANVTASAVTFTGFENTEQSSPTTGRVLRLLQTGGNTIGDGSSSSSSSTGGVTINVLITAEESGDSKNLKTANAIKQAVGKIQKDSTQVAMNRVG